MLPASWLIILSHGGMFSGFYLGLSERYSVMLPASWLIILSHGGKFSGFYLGLSGRYSFMLNDTKLGIWSGWY